MLKNSKYINIFRVLLGMGVLVIGFIILSDSRISIYTVATLLGIAIALEGISLILASSYLKEKNFYSLADLSLGSVFIAFGVIIMIDTNIDFYLLGIFVVVVAFLSLLHQGMVLYERRLAGLKYGAIVGFGIVHVIFGALIIYSVATEGALFNTLVGTYLLNLGVLIIISMIYSRNDLEQI